MRKKTIRKLPPTTRKLAKLLNKLDSTSRKLKNLITSISDIETENIAWQKRQEHFKNHHQKDPIDLD